MQSENQNVRTPDPDSRWERYSLAKLHIREGSPREVFFEAGNSGEDTRRTGEDVSFAIDANYHKGTNTTEKGRRQLVQLNNPTHSNDRVYGEEGISPTLNTMQGGRRQPFVKIAEATKKGYDIAHEGDSINLTCPDSKTRRGRVGKGIANTLDTGMQQHTLDGTRIRRLTPTECERLMSWPDGWTRHGDFGDGKITELSDTRRYKAAGNGVVSEVVKHIVIEHLL